MPSKMLETISSQIEDNGTDRFAKFYMYANLLHVISVREANKTILEVSPKGHGIFNAQTISLGNFDNQFTTLVNEYQQSFAPSPPGKLEVFKKIVSAYARKGQLAMDDDVAEQALVTRNDIIQNSLNY